MIVALCSAVCLTAISTECFRVLQAAAYRLVRCYKYFVGWHFVLLAICQGVEIALFVFRLPQWIAVLPLLSVGVATVFVRRKCTLKYTPRVVRMLLVFAALSVGLCAATVWFGVVFVPVLTIVSWAVMLPVEWKINQRYINLATNKLQHSGVTVVAVVGSYGKTGVKNMLTELLDNACCPGGNVNTPLGIARYINGAELHCKYLVLEFGARQVGDIAELCRLYRPTYGIVVGVCPQHIATFGSLDNIVKEKSSLLDWLPDNGVCVLNGADEIVCEWAKGVCRKVVSGTSLTIEVTSRDMTGQQLTVCDKQGVCYNVKLPQIADYAPDTFAICAEMCLALGQPLERVVVNSARITQTPHRMEVRQANGFFIVDDSYNAGIKGVENSCQTLAEFDCNRVVVAQGIVEGGKQARQLNVRCGQLLGGAFHVAVLCGQNSRYLAEGLRDTCTTVLYADSLADATDKALRYIGKGDILYYQNDLPDLPIL